MVKLHKSQFLRWVVLCFSISVFGAGPTMSAEIDVHVLGSLETGVRAGRVIGQNIILQNSVSPGSDVSPHVSLRLVELMQFEDGQLRVIDPKQQDFVVDLHQSTSCLEWLSFEPGTQQDFQIPPRNQ